MLLSRARWVAGAVLVGVLTAFQSRANGQLAAHLDPYTAAAISFGSGFVVLLVMMVATRANRAQLGRLAGGIRSRSVPVWMLLGGLAGAVTVASQGLTVAVLGVAMFTVGVVAGQTANGLLLDRVGYGPAGVVRLSARRVVGALLAIAGVAVCVSGTASAAPWWMLVLPVLAGAGIAFQQATNGRLRERVGSPLVATFVNFAGGAVILVAAALVHVGVVGWPAAFPAEVWMYTGGLVGVVYIFLSAAIVRHTGVLLLGLGSVVGLLTTSVVLDALWPPASGPGVVRAALAAAIALVGVVVAAVVLPRRRRTLG